jgi:hypothetical protein
MRMPLESGRLAPPSAQHPAVIPNEAKRSEESPVSFALTLSSRAPQREGSAFGLWVPHPLALSL